MLGGSEEDTAKVFFTSVTGRGGRKRTEELFGLIEEGRPVSSFQVEVCFMFAFKFCGGIVGKRNVYGKMIGV